MNGVIPIPVPPAPPVNTGLTGANANLSKVLASGQFAVCVEVSPPVGPNPDAVQKQINLLKGYGDAYNVTDNQSATVHMSSLSVSIMLKQAGMEPIVQFTCRDRNRLGLQADMLGAAAFGINHMLCLSGDHPIWGDHPQCKSVYDLDSVNLIRMVAHDARLTRSSRTARISPSTRLTSLSARSRTRSRRLSNIGPCVWPRRSLPGRNSSRRS